MTTLIAAGPVDRRVGHKTLWFPRYINPVHEGWYQGDHGRMWYWDGDCWNKHGTITGIFGVVRGPNAWRGLMHNVQGDRLRAHRPTRGRQSMSNHDAKTKADGAESVSTDGLEVFPVPSFLHAPAQVGTISMRSVQYTDNGSWGVELTVTGLASEQQAEAAMLHMARLFCAAEIKTQ